VEMVAMFGYLCIAETYVSKLILRPNRAYNSTFNSVCSSLMVPSFSSNAVTSSSIFAVEVESISWTSGRGRETKESPILYLTEVSKMLCKATGRSSQHTGPYRPRLPAQAHLIHRRGPLFLSGRNNQSMALRRQHRFCRTNVFRSELLLDS
jgi:hypothetical protein